jgi:hypothetical protein
LELEQAAELREREAVLKRPRFEVAARKINRLRDVAGAFGLERLGGAGSTGAELDARSEVLASGNRTVAIA